MINRSPGLFGLRNLFLRFRRWLLPGFVLHIGRPPLQLFPIEDFVDVVTVKDFEFPQGLGNSMQLVEIVLQQSACFRFGLINYAGDLLINKLGRLLRIIAAL